MNKTKEDLHRLCYAEEEFEKIHQPWSIEAFQNWLVETWGVEYLPHPTDGTICEINVVNPAKYTFFLLKYPSQWPNPLE